MPIRGSAHSNESRECQSTGRGRPGHQVAAIHTTASATSGYVTFGCMLWIHECSRDRKNADV